MAIGNPINLTSNVESKNISVIATAGQTQFTVTGGYRINQISVFRNGVRLVDGRDFTALDGSIVTLLSAALVGDALEFQIFDDFRVADALSVNSGGTVNGNVTVTGILSTTNLSIGSSISLDATTGIITAVQVIGGTITGTATTAINAQGLIGTPDITVNNIVAAAGTFSGVLTYEDVTNIDSLGIVTARTGVDITANGLVVNAGVSTFAADLSIADKIIHTGDSNTAIRFPSPDTFTVETAGTERLRVKSNGVVAISTGLQIVGGGLTVTGLSTFYSNVDMNGVLQFEGSGTGRILFDVDSYSGSSAPLTFWVGNSGGGQYATIDAGNAGQLQILNTDHPSGVLDFRAKSDFSFQVNGYYSIYSPSSGGVKIYHPASQGNILSQKFETTGGGVIITGVATATSFVGALTGNVTGNSAGTHTGAVDLNGGVLTLDADADTTITADTDDQIDIAFGGNDRITLSPGLIDLKNDGAQSALRLYCEVSNAHYAALQAPAHSAFSGNITLTLPATTDTLVGRTTTDTLTNKTLTSPTITGTGNIAGTFTGNVTGAASQVTVADESSDTTCFPLFATAATGNLPPKSGTNLTFNSSSGALTATSFVGALTGNVTGNTSGTAGGLTGTPNIDCGTGSFTGDVDIADKIIHTGDTNTAIRFPAADTFTVETAGTERLRITSDGKFGFKTTSPDYTVDINGEVGITEGQPLTWHNGSGSASAQIFGDSSDNLIFRNTSSGTERFRIESSGTAIFGGNTQIGGASYGNVNGLLIEPAGGIRATNDTTSYHLFRGYTTGNASNTSSITADGSATFSTVTDSIGPLRRLGIQNKTANYTLVSGDAGKLIRTTTGAITVPASVFTAGDMVSIFNVGSGDVTVSSSAVTVYNSADADTGNTRTIAAKGMATIVCTATDEFVISGSQLT